MKFQGQHRWDLDKLFGDGMVECAASWTEDLMVGRSIPAVAQYYLIFPAQKEERHQEQLQRPGQG